MKANLVVVSTRKDSNLLLMNLVDETMFLVDAPRPTTFNDPKRLCPIPLDPPSEVLERRGVKFQASQRRPRSEAPLDAPWPPTAGASLYPTSRDKPSLVRIQFRARGQSAQSRPSCRRSRP